MNRGELTELHYIAPIANLESMLSWGLLSHRLAARIPHKSVALEEVQARRQVKQVPGGKALHDYVNLYFCARNPMMYKRKDGHAEICVVRVNPSVIDQPGAIVTDMNAATGGARFRPAPAGLVQLDKGLVFADDWRHPGNYDAYLRHRAIKYAEALIPDRVDPSCLTGVYVSYSETEAEVLRIVGSETPVTINGHLFFAKARQPMVQVLVGNLLDSKAQTLVNTVNCVGIMGKGIALEFKKRFPEMFKDYAERCRRGEVHLGQPYLYRRLVPPWILNFPTKDDWRSLTRLSDIEAGLRYLEAHYQHWGIMSLAVPPLGCGNGQLEWRVVGPTLFRYLRLLAIPVELYAPYGTSVDELDADFLEKGNEGDVGSLGVPFKINPAWVALAEIVARITREPYHWPVGRVIFQKIAYFATEAGIPTGLSFQKASFGPFAPSVKGMVTLLQNNALISEDRHARSGMFQVKLGKTYPDAVKRFHDQLSRWERQIERVVDLMLRMQSRQAEIAATVHFAWSSLKKAGNEKPTVRELFDEVGRWKRGRRPAVTDQEIAESIANLSTLGWISIQPSSDLPLPEDEFADA